MQPYAAAPLACTMVGGAAPSTAVPRRVFRLQFARVVGFCYAEVRASFHLADCPLTGHRRKRSGWRPFRVHRGEGACAQAELACIKGRPP